MRIALYQGQGLISRLIRWQTRGAYAHAALLLDDGRVLEAWHHPSGVRINGSLSEQHTPGTAVDIFRVELTPAQTTAALQFALRQLGKPYDFTMIARFVTRTPAGRKASGKWFCSELVFAACQEAGVRLLERVEPWAVSPGMLAWSPLLQFEQRVFTA